MYKKLTVFLTIAMSIVLVLSSALLILSPKATFAASDDPVITLTGVRNGNHMEIQVSPTTNFPMLYWNMKMEYLIM